MYVKAAKRRKEKRDAQTSSGVKVLEATERRSTHRNNVQHVRRRREGTKKKQQCLACGRDVRRTDHARLSRRLAVYFESVVLLINRSMNYAMAMQKMHRVSLQID